ncbi:nucleoside triphosphate pyrophosphatase [Polyangium sp. y55x31]|uniref:Maf family protein n=1 Tax=Polyangium sp. y55x31 TaxID=3042688 RepID=UPI00248235F7|nr:nucleoside triphosphate pyrophosphatase [Polyangium sp. y55x31]MDI1483382.1 nucleoside triphosphate pyrophosphatase [Polyangium sp. y55x31]
MDRLILASTSRFRRALLDRLGLPYEARAPHFDEIPPEGLSPRDVARAFAEGKAKSLDAAPGTWVIGADQVPEYDGRILRKTESQDDCRSQLAELSGRTHMLHTAVVLWSPSEGRMLGETVTVELMMRSLSPALIDRYVTLDDPVGSAGGYLFEKRGIGLFESVRGGDESAIVGLPLLSLCRLLREAGIEPFDLAR